MATAVSTDSGMTGILSGSGHDQLRATVVTGTVPHHAPPELEGSVTPVYDDEGHLYDWRLDPAHADHVLQAQDFQRFASWRSGFASERFLGERVLITSFLDWAVDRCDVSTLQVLRLNHAHVDYHHAMQLDRQLSQVHDYLAKHSAHGYGLFSGGGSKPIRGIVPTAPASTVLALGSDAVTIAEDGLHLHTGGQDYPVDRWQIADGRVTANNSLELGIEVPGRLLRIVGRQAPSIEVQACPVRSMLAPLISFGKEAAELAGSGRTGLYFRSSWA